jgi:hypothetical protein
MEFLIGAILLAGLLFYVGLFVFMTLAVWAGWVFIALGKLLRPVLVPIVRVLDTRLW